MPGTRANRWPSECRRALQLFPERDECQLRFGGEGPKPSWGWLELLAGPNVGLAWDHPARTQIIRVSTSLAARGTTAIGGHRALFST